MSDKGDEQMNREMAEQADPDDAPVALKLRFLKRYLDAADEKVNVERRRLRMEEVSGDGVQQDILALADWFENHPREARAATNYLIKQRKAREAEPAD